SHVTTKLRAPGFKVDGKHVFITGGSTGLGLAVAKQYARAGAKVSLIARRLENLTAAKAVVEAESPRCERAAVFIQSCDVTDAAAVQRAVDAAAQHHGRAVDHLVCSAGISLPDYFLKTDPALFPKITNANYFGVVHAVKAAVPAMLAQREGGHVVIVSSALALLSWVGFSHYASSKYATRGLAEALRAELEPLGVRVSIFYPGNIDTPMYVEEARNKPEESKVIEGASELLHPDVVAQSLIDGVRDGQFSITNEGLVFLVRVLASGGGPRANSALELLLLPLAFVVQIGFGFFMDFVVGQSARAQRREAARARKSV
ncbi:hypothetical protein PybrP1_010270, partial [[Pythium] brassicae (nom. inval.)]